MRPAPLLAALALVLTSIPALAQDADEPVGEPLPGQREGDRVPGLPEAQIDAPEPVPEAPEPLPPTPLPPPPPPAVMVPVPPGAEPPPLEERERHEWVHLGLGYRMNFVPDAAYDSFATSNVLSQLSLQGGAAVADLGPASLAIGGAWDFGSRSTFAPPFDARLTIHRLTVPVEGRYHPARWVYVFGRVAPGVANYQSEITAQASRDTSSEWVFAADASLGGAFLVGPHTRIALARVWIVPEVGYTWSGEAPVILGDDPSLLEGAPANFGSLSLRGAFWRLQLALTF